MAERACHGFLQRIEKGEGDYGLAGGLAAASGAAMAPARTRAHARPRTRVCGDRFSLAPADPATLEDGFLERAELLRPELEKRAGGQPVELIFWYAERLPE